MLEKTDQACVRTAEVVKETSESYIWVLLYTLKLIFESVSEGGQLQVNPASAGFGIRPPIWNNCCSISTILFSHAIIVAVLKTFCKNALRFAYLFKAAKAS